MSMVELLKTFIGKDIHVVMNGSPSALPGKLTKVADSYFVMETRASKNQYFDILKIITFWAE